MLGTDRAGEERLKEAYVLETTVGFDYKYKYKFQLKLKEAMHINWEELI